MTKRETDIRIDRAIKTSDDIAKVINKEREEAQKKIGRMRTVVEEQIRVAKTEVNDHLSKLSSALFNSILTLENTVSEKSFRAQDLQNVQAIALIETKESLEKVVEKQQKQMANLQAEVDKLKEKLENRNGNGPYPRGEGTNTETDPRASTLAIFDSIVFAMSSWSNEGDTAPDFELACQSILFPTIYERVMKNEDDYYIEEVPVSALEVVKRGREYIKMLRDTAQASLVDPEIWENYAPMVQEWWVNDALPLLYGARSEEWDKDKPFSLIEVQEWKAQPASRALHFPLLFDGMELVEKHRDQIRETTGLPEFNKQTLQTRINP